MFGGLCMILRPESKLLHIVIYAPFTGTDETIWSKLTCSMHIPHKWAENSFRNGIWYVLAVRIWYVLAVCMQHNKLWWLLECPQPNWLIYSISCKQFLQTCHHVQHLIFIHLKAKLLPSCRKEWIKSDRGR